MNKRFQTIRKVIITGPMEERNKALSWAYQNGYTTHFSGPQRAKAQPGDQYPRVDIDHFKIVAEKRIK